VGVVQWFSDFAARRDNRIMVDSDGSLSAVVRSTFSAIEEDERVLFVIDDSPLCNRKNIVVFTNKRIYGNLKSAYFRVTTGNTQNATAGPCSIDLGLLTCVSVFTRENSRSTIVYAISKTAQLEIRLKHKIYGDIIRLYFSEKLLNYSGGYNPDRKANTALFKEFVAERKKDTAQEITPRDVIAVILGAANLIAHGFLLAVSLFRVFSPDRFVPEFSITQPPLFTLALLFCLLNALFGKKNSAALLFLLICITCGMFITGIFLNLPFDINKFFLAYSIAAIILGITDFDRIFKQVTGFFAICAVIFMMLHFLR
jgi:hypothetical protein